MASLTRKAAARFLLRSRTGPGNATHHAIVFRALARGVSPSQSERLASFLTVGVLLALHCVCRFGVIPATSLATVAVAGFVVVAGGVAVVPLAGHLAKDSVWRHNIGDTPFQGGRSHKLVSGLRAADRVVVGVLSSAKDQNNTKKTA